MDEPALAETGARRVAIGGDAGAGQRRRLAGHVEAIAFLGDRQQRLLPALPEIEVAHQNSHRKSNESYFLQKKILKSPLRTSLSGSLSSSSDAHIRTLQESDGE